MRNEAIETDRWSCPEVNFGISSVENLACHQHMSVFTLIPTELFLHYLRNWYTLTQVVCLFR